MFGKLFVLALAAIMLLSAVHAGITISNYTVLPASVRPGVSGSVILTIANLDEKEVTGLALEVSSSDVLGSGGHFSYGDFKTGVSTIVTVPFRVSRDAGAGVYTSLMKFSWFTDDGSFSKSVSIPIVVQNPALLQIVGTGETVYADNDFVLEGKIRNTGGKALDAGLYINGSQFLPNGPSPLLLGDVLGEEAFQMPIAVDSGVGSGVQSIPIYVRYVDELGAEQLVALPVTINLVRLGPDFAASVTGDNILTQGDRVGLRIALANIGNEDAYNAYVSIVNSSVLTPIGNAEVRAGDIAAGKSGEAVFLVGVNDVPPGFYPLRFQVRYENRNGEAQPPKFVNAGFNIAGKNEVSFFISTKPEAVSPGAGYTLQVQVSNVGSAPLKALVVSVMPEPVKLLNAQPSQFIGGLSQDDFSTVQYKILVPDNLKPGRYPILLSASFKDSYNKDHTVNQTLFLTVVSREEAAKASGAANGGISPIVILVGLAVAAGVGYYAYRRFFAKKKEKPHSGL